MAISKPKTLKRRGLAQGTGPSEQRFPKRMKLDRNKRIPSKSIAPQSSSEHPVAIDTLASESELPDNKSLESLSEDVALDPKLRDATEDYNTGVVYLGRIPHGFYENEMRSYFSQFGMIKRLRLCRNKITGNSKHYAFIEFSSAEVAQIVAETMNNYMLYGHILKCRVLPESECTERMWIGANRKWKVPPLGKLRRIKYERKRSLEGWDTLQKRETSRRLENAKRWQDVGIEYEFDSPEMFQKQEVRRLKVV